MINMKYVVRRAPSGVGYVIIAAREIKTTVGVVAKGTIGGFLLRGNELSQSDNSWVFPGGEVYDGKVIGNAVVFGVSIDSIISGNAVVGMNTTVFRSSVKNHAIVAGKVILNDCTAKGHAVIQGVNIGGGEAKSIIMKSTTVSGRAVVSGNGGFMRCAVVNGHAKISDGTTIKSSTVGGYANIADCVVCPGNRIYTGIYRGDSIAADTIRQKPNMD